MANVNRPFGLRQIQGSTGAASNFEMVQVPIAYNATPIYRGDPVMMMNTGYVEQWDNGTAARLLYGIFWGCTYLSSSQGKQVPNNFWPGADVASTAQSSISGWVIPIKGTDTKFIVQSDGTGIAFADIGLNADITLGTGNALNGQSGAYLSGPADTATLPFQIVGLYGGLPGQGGFMGAQPGDNGNPYGGSATGAYNWVIVRANWTGQQGI